MKSKRLSEFMYFKPEGATSTLSGGPLKLVDKYLGNSVSSSENDVNIHLGKAIDRLSII